MAGTATGTQVPAANRLTEKKMNTPATIAAATPVTHAPATMPVPATTSASPSASAAPCPHDHGVTERPAPKASMMLACASGPVILPWGNGVVNTSNRPCAVAPMTTTLSLKAAGSSSGVTPSSSAW